MYVDGELSKNLQNIEYEFRSEEFKAMVSMSPVVPAGSVLLMGELRKGSLDSSKLKESSPDRKLKKSIAKA